MNMLLKIKECLLCNCYQKESENCYQITTLNENITLSSGYTLSILSLNENTVTIKIEYLNNIYYRVLNTNFPLELCMHQNNCYAYYIYITVSTN